MYYCATDGIFPKVLLRHKKLSKTFRVTEVTQNPIGQKSRDRGLGLGLVLGFCKSRDLYHFRFSHVICCGVLRSEMTLPLGLGHVTLRVRVRVRVRVL